MAPSSKQPMSGLRSIKRDFSSSSLPAASQSSTASDADSIPWDPNPPKKLSGLEQRLKDIQDALNTQISSSETTLSQSQKRPSTSQNPPAKRRHLPGNWDLPEKSAPTTSKPSYPTASSARASGTARQVESNETLVIPSTTKSGAASKPAPVFLSQEQTHILRLVESGQSLFYTGSADVLFVCWHPTTHDLRRSAEEVEMAQTPYALYVAQAFYTIRELVDKPSILSTICAGKSVLLREIIKSLKKRFAKIPDAVAVTASTGIAACNIGGVTIHSFAGIGLGTENHEQLASKVRKNRKATTRWLRTKVLIIDEVSMVDGDLFDKLARIGQIIRKRPEPFGGIQVVVTGDFFQLPPVMKGSGTVKFAFEGEMWPQTIKKTFNLTKVFRQRDPEFVDMLNEMRFGRLTDKSIQRFKALSRDIVYEDGLGATELFPRREDVERSNGVRMTGITGKEQVYSAYDGGTVTDLQQREKMLANFMPPKRLVLKEGAQVMLIKNMDEMLVNGTMGKILRFVDPAAPLDHEDGLLGGGKPPSKPASKPAKDPKASLSGRQLLPLVEFLQPGGIRRQVVIQPENWKVELPSGEIQVSRTQLPLILAWAMSIHKSQGQTLERVKVDLAKVFEKGQAYVALSRATSLDGLQVLHFDPMKVQAHPKVVEWSKTLETVKD
ncbi:ATP-dependent DNA helicase PIF1 [Trametes pubescens]|uniref:ATP-dependent DNA helicase PIF1 n=1 Tax=Trametes pubescens TaxID=154538 RepID=A0A1M2VTG0_TRAPU|nr:ATP-dependent DNA helicase PIF1 [Trametes pubescens]